jgi:hypothetical protein
MKKHLALALGLLFVVGALAGCGGKSTQTSGPSSSGNTGGATAADQAQVADELANNTPLVEEDVYQSDTPMQLDGGSSGTALVRPLRWWRHIDSNTRTFQTDFSNPDSLGRPTMATVTVRHHLLGTFNLVAGDTAAGDTSRTLIKKPLDDNWVRKLLLRRVRIDSLGLSQTWRIVGTSGVKVTSKDAVTHIAWIRVQAGLRDTTISDPLELHRLRRVLWIADNTAVHITVKTNSSDDVVVLYRNDGRRRFHANGDGTFSIDFVTGDFPGLRHFGVNALSRGTLFDDVAPYDSQAWILPFAVRDIDALVTDRE